ncbi:MAG TPA: transporter substrate-binding domain-containing protein [Hyphomicrobiaceae bacterium]|nr:transporter substrate-binding domain-containing protein [Hyphomicrobiaceae bacterium]
MAFRNHTAVCFLGLFGLLLAALGARAAAPKPAPSSVVVPADIFDAIRHRGHLRCGVNDGETGLSTVDKAGRWSGMNADLCHALAAAILGDRTKVEFRDVPSSRRFAALRDREIDVLARSTGWTLSRDLEPNLRFVTPLYHDGQSFLTRKSNGITSALELTGATVCLLSGSLAETAVSAFFNRHGMKFTPVRADTWSDLVAHYNAKRCLVLAGGRISLATEPQSHLKDGPHVMLPEVVAPEAFGPMVLSRQPRWERLVAWTIYALITAEDLAISKATLDAMLRSTDTGVRRLLGLEGTIGPQLGVSKDWVVNMIRQVGNYADIHERNLGLTSPLGLSRGLNALARNGGLLFAPAFR